MYENIKEAFKSLFINILIISSMVLLVIYLTWRILFTLPLEENVFVLIFGLLLVLSEIFTALMTLELLYRKYKSNNFVLKKPVILKDQYPDVDVFIATHNESYELLYKTIVLCLGMKYYDQSKVHIYVCDDNDRSVIRELAKKLNVNYLGLRANKDAKAGNLNNALANTQSEFIATFDADMLPQSNFLLETIPYFFLPLMKEENGKWEKRNVEEIDPNFKVGLVQTPQSFYNPDLFQFNLYAENLIPNEQDFFSREINVLRNAANAIAYTGSNAIISRSALKAIGGFPTNTITEDFETSIRFQKEGFATYATSEVLAAGLAAVTIRSLIQQRIRWARGVIQSIYNTNAIFTKKLSFSARITYLNSYLYWWSFFFRMIFILAPILFALFDIKVVNCSFWELLIFWLPSYIFYSLSLHFLSSNIRNQRWSQVVDTVLAPFLILPVLLESLKIKEKKFKVTEKNKSKEGVGNYIYVFCHLFLIILSFLALSRFIAGKYGMALVYSSVIIYWLCHNLISLFYAFLFMLGRNSYKNEDRIYVQEELKIISNDIILKGKSVYFTDQSLLFVLDSCQDFTNNKFQIEIKAKEKVAILDCNLISNFQKDACFYYEVDLKSIDEFNKRLYFQIIYDREHSLPKELDLWTTAYDDLIRNVKIRLINVYHKFKEIKWINLFFLK